jgi:hypothetical protein
MVPQDLLAVDGNAMSLAILDRGGLVPYALLIKPPAL